MRWLRCEAARLDLSRRVACVAMLGLAVAMGGCATSAADQAASAQPMAQGQRVEMEDDGLPPQVAPSAAIRQHTDDPSEPFSPNYGAPPAPLSVPMRLSSADEEAIIARAIAAHEMRRP